MSTELPNDPPAKLTCQELVTLVTDYLEAALDPETERRFEAHVAACNGCRRYLGQMQRTIATVGQLREEDLSPAARDHLLDAFRDWKREAAG